MWSMWSSTGWKTSGIFLRHSYGYALPLAGAQRLIEMERLADFLRSLRGFFPQFWGVQVPHGCVMSIPGHIFNAFGIWNSSHHSSLQRWSKSLFLYISAHEFPLLLSGSLTKLWGSRFQDPKPRRFLVVDLSENTVTDSILCFKVKASSSPLKVP